MRLSEIKKEMLAWEDHYGQDIHYTDEIKSAKNKNELSEVFDRYRRYLEDQNNDAIRGMEEFQRSLGLNY